MAKETESTKPTDPTSELNERFKKLSGADKAAMLMLLMGEEHAAQVINHLEPKDIQTLGKKMVEVANLPKDVVNAVLDEFLISTSKMSDLGTGNSEYIQKVFNKALGEDKASAALDKIIPEQSLKGLDMLRWMDAGEIYTAIEAEHPQVIAVVLSVLDHDVAGALIKMFPEDVRSDVIARIGSLSGIQPSALARLEEVLKSQFLQRNSSSKTPFGGVEAAAKILNFSGSEIETSILKSVEAQDQKLAEAIEENMVTFMDIDGMDNKSLQTLIRELDNELLIPALKGADESIKEIFLENMSERARELFEDDLEAMGPIRVSEVDKAQKEIMRVARRLSGEGEIMLSGGGNEFI
ncbi:MAG: flagellar motor switch protein FliG [Gammaproteobacteria bacterium]|nr:flagellar motor switch protein FliG [Gammaproteobacteria bacterium]HBW84770.1 flagellar motor switch protein FliG [Gammaproteobacteria bacterium]|tara:strand:- start:5763 stop:6818 length:1056 start_codon:yes stop_codon:yes gene_type:complete